MAPLQLGLPAVVGLDLSASNIDDSAYKLPALAVARLDLAQGAGGAAGASGAPPPTDATPYLCLGADNSMYVVLGRHVAGVLEGAAPAGLDVPRAAAVAAAHADSLRGSAWKELASEVRSAGGSALTALAATRLPPGDALAPVVPAEEGLAALVAQRRRVSGVKSELAEIKSDRKFMKAARRFSKQVRGWRAGVGADVAVDKECYGSRIPSLVLCFMSGRVSLPTLPPTPPPLFHRAQAAQASALLERAEVLREEMEEAVDGSWRKFEELVGILTAVGA